MKKEVVYTALFIILILAVLVARFSIQGVFVEGGLLGSSGLSNYVVAISVVFFLVALGAVLVAIAVKAR